MTSKTNFVFKGFKDGCVTFSILGSDYPNYLIYVSGYDYLTSSVNIVVNSYNDLNILAKLIDKNFNKELFKEIDDIIFYVNLEEKSVLFSLSIKDSLPSYNNIMDSFDKAAMSELSPNFLSSCLKSKNNKKVKRKLAIKNLIKSIDNERKYNIKQGEVFEGSYNVIMYMAKKDENLMGTLNFATRWSKFMDYIIEKHNISADKIAKNTLEACNFENLCYSQLITALTFLKETWRYSDDLNNFYLENE